MNIETIRFRNIVSVLPHASTISLRPDQQRGTLKTKRDATNPDDRLPKPDWIRVKAASPTGRFRETKDIVRAHQLITVCEEASCPNIGECWSKGTATFMIMGDKCTRRCRFCNVSTGRPDRLDADEPQRLAETIALMKLSYVVITSVDRDDLRDGGAGHFVQCIQRIRALAPSTTIEILTPDFSGRLDLALDILCADSPDVLNHNIETVPRLYKEARPGADFQNTLNLLQGFKARQPGIPTKSGLMVGLGESDEEVLEVLQALRAHGVDMLTIGQYLQPTVGHMPVRRYVHPDVFRMYADVAKRMGFRHAASGPLVRSSYHADEQARSVGLLPPFEHLAEFISRGVAIYKKQGAGTTLPLVWGASIASYPFFGKTAETAGRLLALQGDCAIKELQRRMAEQYGDRSGIERAVTRVLQSQVSWAALTRDETAKRIIKRNPVLIESDELTTWLVEAALRYAGKPASVPSLQSLPVLFPFTLTRPLAYLASNSPDLVLRSEGPSNQFVELKRR